MRSSLACCLLTVVSAPLQEVPGFTWCPKGCESRITHLVPGGDNPDSRTEKVEGLLLHADAASHAGPHSDIAIAAELSSIICCCSCF